LEIRSIDRAEFADVFFENHEKNGRSKEDGDVSELSVSSLLSFVRNGEEEASELVEKLLQRVRFRSGSDGLAFHCL